ncbi:MAG: serine hydrolase domain-containing protein [Verrucomicrobiales bacterium]
MGIRPFLTACLAAGLFALPARPAPAAPADLAEALAAICEERGVPGLAAAAGKGDEVLALGAAGVRRMGGDEAATVEDKWHIGSCTKSMTATLAAILVEEGAIGWDATVGEKLRDLKPHDGYKGVTLEQLLAHRGGAPHQPPAALWATAFHDRKPTPQDQRLRFAKGILAEGPAQEAGAKFAYSNAGYTLAGIMLERAGRRPWEDLMRDRLFTPLKMDSAGFGPPAGVRGDKVDQPWGHLATGTPVPPNPQADNPPAIGPGGTVHCSIGDLLRYALLHARRDALLKPETFAALHEPRGEGGDYALGWIVTERAWAGGKTLFHNGTNTMNFAVMWVSPKRGIAAVAATNMGGKDAEKACDQAVGAALEAALKAVRD